MAADMPAFTWHIPIAHTTGPRAPAFSFTLCHLVHIQGWDPSFLVKAQLVIQSHGEILLLPTWHWRYWRQLSDTAPGLPEPLDTWLR